MLLIGLAVGVDYSMFYLRRNLEERTAGRDNRSALAVAAATSGRAVLVSGLTVMVAMAGMFLAGSSVFRSFGMGTILVVAVAIVGSLTVLPAMIAWLGDRVERGRIPIIAKRRQRGESRVWGAVLDRVLRRPAVSLALGASLLSRSPCPRSGCTRSIPASPVCRRTCRSCRPTTASRPRSRAARCRRPSSCRRPTSRRRTSRPRSSR